MNKDQAKAKIKIPGCSILDVVNGCTLVKDYVMKKHYWFNADFDKMSAHFDSEEDARATMATYDIVWNTQH